MIKEIKTYEDENERQIKAYYTLDTNLDATDAKPTLEGRVGIPTPMGAIPVDFEFPPDFTLEQCFEHYEEVASAAANEKIDEINDANRIVSAGPTPPKQGNELIFPGK